MNFHAFMTSMVLLLSIIGCGEDIKGSRDRGKPDTIRPPVVGGIKTTIIYSHMHRPRGVAVLTYSEEITKTIARILSSAYRQVPLMQKDNEGEDQQNIISLNSLGRPTETCGTGVTFDGVDARIKDCQSKNGTSSIWEGVLYGAAGEGTWKLVSRSESGREIWEDIHTGMVWSEILPNSANWCKASGNKQKTTAGINVDCETLGENESLCHGSATAGIGDDIRWRLPTRNDYLQADLNGIRFVLKPGTEQGFWTATMKSGSEGHEHAWVYHMTEATLTAEDLRTMRHVRCIGAPVR